MDSLPTFQKLDTTTQKVVPTPIPIVTIKRTYNHPDGTFGTIAIDGNPFAWTLELAYKNNERDISSIPKGEYDIERWESTKFGETFKVNVKFRDNILIHPANLTQELKGCIAIGKETGKLQSKLAVLHSRAAFSEFLEKLRGYDKGRLIIEEPHFG